MAAAKKKEVPKDVSISEKRLGASGVMVFGGTLFNNEDYNSDLAGQAGRSVYEQMRRSDPDVASGLSKITMPLLSADWSIEPAEKDSDEEKEIAKFCEKWVMGRGRLDPFSMSWQDFLRHALLMLSDGFSAFEKVWGMDDEGRQVYSILGPILPKSVDTFQFKTDGSGALDYMRQRCFTADRGYVTADIPAEKLVLFNFSREGDNLWGWPILRAAYKPWYLKKTLEIIDGIRHERHGVGFAVMKIPAGASDTTKTYAEQVAREMRVHDRQGVVIEDDMDLQILYPTGQGSDIVGSIGLLRTQILQVLLSEFMEHGTGPSGSRALVTSKIDLMMLSLQGIARQIEETVNRQLIVPLVYRNYGPREKYPTLKCEDMDKMGGTELADILSKFATASLVHPRADLEQHILKTLQLPEIPEDELAQMKKADDAAREMAMNPPDPLEMAKAKGQGAPPPKDGDKPPKEEKPKIASEPAPLIFRREPFPHEAHMQFSEIRSFLDDEPKRIWHRVIAPFREKQIAGLAAEAASAPDVALSRGRLGDSVDQRMARAGSIERRMADDLAGALMRCYTRGRGDVVAELNRQRTVKMAEDAEDDGIEETEPTTAQKAWVKRLAESFVTGSTIALVGEAIRASIQARQADLPKATIERRVTAALEDLSIPRQQAQLEGQITRAYTTGRDEQATAVAEAIETYRYTAILDEATCQSCESRDGAEHDGTDPNYETPSPYCDWPDNCRCFDVYVAKTATKEEAA